MEAYTQTPLKKSYLKLPPLRGDCGMTIPDMVKELAHGNPDEMAFVFRAPGQPRVALTRKELLDQSTGMAHYFVSLGIEVGDKVAVLIRSGKPWIIVQLGLYVTGVIAVNWRSYDSDGLQETAERMGCAATIIDTDGRPAHGIHQDSQPLQMYFNNNGNKSSMLFGTSPYSEKYEETLPSISPDSPAMIFFTSGSSGEPKCVIQTHKAIAIQAVSSRCLGLSGDDVLLTDRPIMWSGGYPKRFGVKEAHMSISRHA